MFKRIFICFAALKQGWKDSCRPLIGLDGSFLKGKVKEEVLVDVGKDASNQIFPIAWVITDMQKVKELDIKEQWKSLTILSNMQKVRL